MTNELTFPFVLYHIEGGKEKLYAKVGTIALLLFLGEVM